MTTRRAPPISPAVTPTPIEVSKETPVVIESKPISEIVTDIQRYRGLADLLVIYNDKDIALEETKKFNDYLKLFSHFTGDEEPEET